MLPLAAVITQVAFKSIVSGEADRVIGLVAASPVTSLITKTMPSLVKPHVGNVSVLAEAVDDFQAST